MKRWIEDDAPPPIERLLRSHDPAPEPGSAERVWRRLQTPRSRRPSPLAWGLGLAAAAAVLLVGLWPSDPPDLWVRSVEGRVWAGEETVEAEEGLFRPVELRVEDDAEVELETPSGDRFWVSSLSMLGTESPHQWSLKKGAVEVWAQARRPEAPLTVGAGPWKVSVLGTRFRVERFDEELRVRVIEGRVRVDGPERSMILATGESFDSRSPPSVDSAAATLSAETPEAPEPSPRPEPTVPPSRPELAVPSHRPEPAVPSHRPEPAVPPPPERVPPPSPTGGAGGPEASPTPALESGPEAAQEALLGTAKTTGDLDDALALFDEAAEMGPPLDEVAAFRAAQIAREAGRRKEALARLKEHVRRWPSGELTEIAWLDAVRLLLDEDRVQEAQTELRSFAAAFPASANQPEVAFLRGEVRRGLGDHRGAAQAYAISARAPHFAERARFLRGLSLARAGEIERARQVLTNYLAEHSNGADADAAREILGDRKKSEGEQRRESFTGTPKEGPK